MEDQAILQKIEYDRKIVWESDSEFLFEYQRAVLLALKEIGTLNEMQYRYAENELKNQRHTFVKRKIACNNRGGGEKNDSSCKLLPSFNG